MKQTYKLALIVLLVSGLFISATSAEQSRQMAPATLGIQSEQQLTADNSGVLKHVIVYKEPGRWCGWPATHGIWNWGNEILVGFRLAYYKVKGRGLHNIDPDRPGQVVRARSLDGGETWTLEKPKAFLAPSFKRDKKQPRCPVQINFMHPDFALAGHSSFFYFSYDRGKSWKGPYTLSTGQKGTHTMGAVNNYIVNGKHDCFAFITFTKNKKSRHKGQRPVCIRTADGGRTWDFVSWMAPKTAGYSIMPSTVRLSQNRLLSAIRRKEKRKRGGFLFFIEIYSSNDNCKTWKFLSKIGSTGKANGNPPSMIRLKDGRIVVTYGYRAKPYGIRAKISCDNGKTWGQVIHLRNDGLSADLGYPRTIQRPDGKIVTVYYFTTKENPQQHIAATIWDPDKISSKISENYKKTTPAILQKEPEKELATLGIQANWPVAVRTMQTKARVYIDRKANFTRIPQFLQGLRYTLHRRKRIINISCRVKTSGWIYLCLFGDKTPKSIGQHGDWKKCGTMRGPSFQGKNRWTIYHADVKAGQILTFSRDDKMGLTIAAKKITKDKTRPLPETPPGIEVYHSTVGKSVENRPLECFFFGRGQDVVFILATIHGDEYVGTPLLHRLAVYLQEHPYLLKGRKVILLPNANPDGMAHFDHFNANGVDLNRNFDSKNRRNGGRNGRRALSEPEAVAIHKIIKNFSPDRIVSIHQMMGWQIGGKRSPGMVDHEGPAEQLAKRMSDHCRLPVERYGTQRGSLGAYAGDDLGIPIITLEIPKFDYGLSEEQLWEKYANALIAAIVYPEKVNTDRPENKIKQTNQFSPVLK